MARTVSINANKNFFVIFFDMVYCGFAYQAGYNDYHQFEFYLLNRAERKTFLTRGKNNQIVKKFNDKNSFYKFDDKPTFNQIFNKYLKRNWMVIDNSNSNEFVQFVKTNKSIIVKPITGTHRYWCRKIYTR